MKDLEVIKEQEVLGKEFRIYGDADSPLFLAKDVADWIEHTNSSEMLKMVDDDEKLKIFCTISNISNAYKPTESVGSANRLFLTEDGLYEVLMQSRMPIAREFKKEVKKILKSIRQTGGYIPIQEDDDESSIMAKALLIAQKTLDKKDALLKQKEEQIIEMKPKVDFANSVTDSDDAISIGDYAKTLFKEGVNIGRNRLFTWLRDNDYLMRDNVPYQRFMQYFRVVENTYVNPRSGESKIVSTTLINGKGQLYFHKKVEDYFGKKN